MGLSEGRRVPSRSLQPAGVLLPSLPRTSTTHGHHVRCSDNVWKVLFSISCKIKSQIKRPSPSCLLPASKQVFVQSHSYRNVFRLQVDIHENEFKLISCEHFCSRSCFKNAPSTSAAPDSRKPSCSNDSRYGFSRSAES